MSRSDSSVTKGFFTFAGRKELPPHSVFKIDFQEILKKKSLGTEEQMKYFWHIETAVRNVIIKLERRDVFQIAAGRSNQPWRLFKDMSMFE